MVKRIAPLALLLGALAALALPGEAHATPPDTHGFFSRSISLGGAVTADVEDASANYYNPAGLVRSGQLRLSIGYMDVHHFLELNGQRSDVERHGALIVGLVAPVNLGDARFAFGLGLHLPDQRLARTRSAVVDRPRWEMYDTRPGRIYLATNLAFSPVSWLTLGVGITFQAPSELTLDIRGDADAFMPDTQSRLEHQFRGDLTSIRYPQAGLQIRPHEMISIGLAYRGSFELRNTIIALADANITGVGEPIPLDFSLVAITTSMYGPQQASLGFAFDPTSRLHFSVELTWYDWSKHPSLIADQEIILRADPPPGLNIDIPDEITSLEPLPLGLHDTWVPRIGVEVGLVETDAVQVDGRLGYVYENSPFPAQTGILNFVDNDKHTFSLGFGLTLSDLRPTLPGTLRFDVHGIYSYLPARDHVKTSTVDPVGDYRSAGHLAGGGAALEIAFE
tara:strand:+ start:223 stop:1575 length:1353 start_codon:yes stop_codon:yes gene_type:complete